MSKYIGSFLIGGFLMLSASPNVLYAQAPPDTSANSGSSANKDTTAQPPTVPVTPSPLPKAPAATVAPSENKLTSSLFYFLLISGKTKDQFRPLTQKERAEVYAKGLLSPFHFLTAAGSAGIAQWKDTPAAWGQGADGFADRFGNYMAKQAVQRTLRWWGEAALHEDNRYFGSGEHGIWRRTRYAVVSSVLARHDNGKQYFSFSQLGSTAGAAFISRLWQPSTNSSAGDGAESFGIAMGASAGLNVLREFLPDAMRKIHLAK
jgi:hypothetical protein